MLQTMNEDFPTLQERVLKEMEIQVLTAYCILCNGPARLRYLFQLVQIQTTTAYCRILPTLDHNV